MNKKWASLLITLALCGCTSMGQVELDQTTLNKDESIFIIGVSSENYRITAFPGAISNGKFDQSLIRISAVYGSGKDGYVIGKAKAGDTLAITKVRYVADSDALLRGKNFSPCGDSPTMVFDIPGGKIIYVGSVSYSFTNHQLHVEYADEFEAVKTYIKQKFPSFEGKVEFQKPQLLPTTKFCDGGAMQIPVYINRK